MARGRMISKSLSTSQRFAALEEAAGPLGEFCQALYMLLVSHADDFGRQAGDEFTVKHAVVPASSRKIPEITGALTALSKVGLIEWYEAEDGRKCIEIRDFTAHQSGLHKRTTSRFPGPSGKFPEIPAQGKGTEGKGTEEDCDEPHGDSSPPVLTFVTARKGLSWVLTEARLQGWREAYPNLDVMAECRKAHAWLDANPAKRKTPRGMPAFLVRWFTNATDRPRLRAADRPEPRGVTVPDVEETRKRYLSA